MTMPDPPSLPDFVSWSVFPFAGDLQVRAREPRNLEDAPRAGDPSGSPCEACATPDTAYLWVDQHWRVRPPSQRSGAPVQLFLETRAHLDMDELDDDLAAEMGRMVVRLERAIQAVGGITRAHVNRWGDGGSHFHLWFYGRPTGETQMLGFCMPLWAMTLPQTPESDWNRDLAIVASELAKDGGRAMV